MNMAIRINENTEHDVFVGIYPHVDQLEFRIYVDGWETEKDPDYYEFKLSPKLDHALCEKLVDVFKELIGGKK